LESDLPPIDPIAGNSVTGSAFSPLDCLLCHDSDYGESPIFHARWLLLELFRGLDKWSKDNRLAYGCAIIVSLSPGNGYCIWFMRFSKTSAVKEINFLPINFAGTY